MTTTEMYDSVDVAEIPAGVPDAGYVDGTWPTFTKLHGTANLSIAVRASDDAECLDVEAGDATNAEAGAWAARQRARGVTMPVLYTSVSNVRALLGAVGQARSTLRIWTAHYLDRPHLCTAACGAPAGFLADATQWTCHSGGRNLDESLLSAGFFAPAVAPAAPAPRPAATAVAAPAPAVGLAPVPAGGGYWVARSDGSVFSFGTARYHGGANPGAPGAPARLAAPIVGIAATPTGAGYWLLGADGGVLTYGDAGFYGVP